MLRSPICSATAGSFLPLASCASVCCKLRQVVCCWRPPMVRPLRCLHVCACEPLLLLLEGALLVLLHWPAHGQLLEGTLQRRLLVLPPPSINRKQRLLVMQLLHLVLLLCLLSLLLLRLLLLLAPLLQPPLVCSACGLPLDQRRLRLLATCTEHSCGEVVVSKA